MDPKAPFLGRRLIFLGGLALLTGICLAGIQSRADDAAATTATNSAATPTSSANDEADKAWREVQKLTQPPMPPAEWQQKQPTQDEAAKFYIDALQKAADAAKDFYTRFPNSPHADEAHKAEYHLLNIAATRFGDTNQTARIQALENKRATDPSASKDEQFDVRFEALKRLMADLPASLPDVEKSARALQKDFPDRAEVYQVLLRVMVHSEGEKKKELARLISDSPAPDEIKMVVKIIPRLDELKKLYEGLPGNQDEFKKAVESFEKDFPGDGDIYQEMVSLLMRGEGEKSRTLAGILLASSAPNQFKEMAKGILKRLDAVGKPLDLQYTAVDGRDVNISKMNGKVVLVDFWATWCGPCMMELPNVKAAYRKLHDKGFEIVGISFDEDKDALEKTLKEKEMTWPQYFDGKGWQNKYSDEFGIKSIPTMWLVDKKGNLRDIDAREDLEGKITKLLAE